MCGVPAGLFTCDVLLGASYVLIYKQLTWHRVPDNIFELIKGASRCLADEILFILLWTVEMVLIGLSIGNFSDLKVLEKSFYFHVLEYLV